MIYCPIDLRSFQIFQRMCDWKVPASLHSHKPEPKEENCSGCSGRRSWKMQHASNYDNSRAKQGCDCVQLCAQIVGISLTSTSRTMPPPIPASIRSSMPRPGRRERRALYLRKIPRRALVPRRRTPLRGCSSDL